jgi:hypothetical protein
MTLQFNKYARVIIQHPATVGNVFFGRVGNEVTITDLRIQFEVTLSLTKSPNHCDVTITNLNKDSRAEFQEKPLVVRLEGGYDHEYAHIFTGDLRFGSSKLDPPDWETKLQLADGDRAFRSARVSRTYVKGTPLIMALKETAGSMGLALPTDPTSSRILAQLQTQMKAGDIIDGPSHVAMSRLLAPYGATWSIQNGKLQILTGGMTTAGTAYIISSNTGLKGSPEAGVPERAGTKRGNTVSVKAKMTLSPHLYPGQLVQVQSKQVNGNFRLTKVTHKGDTHGDEWDSEIAGTAA